MLVCVCVCMYVYKCVKISDRRDIVEVMCVCVYVCVCMHVYEYMKINDRCDVCIYIYIYIICICIHMHTYIHTVGTKPKSRHMSERRLAAGISTHAYACMYVYIYNMYMYTHAYIHTYIQWEEGLNRDIYLTEGSLRESLHVDDGQFGIQS